MCKLSFNKLVQETDDYGFHPSFYSFSERKKDYSYNCKKFQSIESIKAKSIDLSDKDIDLSAVMIYCCEHMKSLPKLFENTKKIDIWYLNCTIELDLSNYNITHLGIFNSSIKSINKLPINLEELTIYDCYDLESISLFPQSLEKITISFFEEDDCKGKLKSLPKLPESLNFLVLCGIQLFEIPKINSLLEVLCIKRCYNISELPTLPNTLLELTIEDCPKLEIINDLPRFIEDFNISNNIYLRHDLHELYRPNKPMVPHPQYKFIMAEAKLNLHLPVLQNRWIEKMYDPRSNYISKTVKNRFYQSAMKQIPLEKTIYSLTTDEVLYDIYKSMRYDDIHSINQCIEPYYPLLNDLVKQKPHIIFRLEENKNRKCKCYFEEILNFINKYQEFDKEFIISLSNNILKLIENLKSIKILLDNEIINFN